MITTTPNLELTKDSTDEFYDVTRVNANMDKIDAAVAAKADKSELPNIHKNPAATTGDIIDTHLTVGAARAEGTIGSGSFVSGGMYGDNLASGMNSAVVGGNENTVSAINAAIAGGNDNTSKAANGVITGGAHNVIDNTSENSNSSAIVGGEYNTADGFAAAVVGGYQNETTGRYGICLGGNNNSAGKYQVKMGHCAKDGESHTDEGGVRSGDALIIGNGSIVTSTQEVTRSNAFRVSYAGRVYGTGAYSSSGADYAEFFEWQDGNPGGEDRRGIFVTLDGEKIRPCNAGEYTLGVVSSNPSVCGDSGSENWHGMYETNIFGDIIYDNGEPKISPRYDPSKTYVPREIRPEWAAVGMLGKLVVVDDGTCEPNGYCVSSQNGIATAAETGYRVLSRIDDTHIKILMR